MVREGKYIGGYKCWDCSTPDKPFMLRSWRLYVLHLKRTKKHNLAGFDELKCPDCDDFCTPRGWALRRHRLQMHGPKVWLAELLQELVFKLVDRCEGLEEPQLVMEVDIEEDEELVDDQDLESAQEFEAEQEFEMVEELLQEVVFKVIYLCETDTEGLEEPQLEMGVDVEEEEELEEDQELEDGHEFQAEQEFEMVWLEELLQEVVFKVVDLCGGDAEGLEEPQLVSEVDVEELGNEKELEDAQEFEVEHGHEFEREHIRTVVDDQIEWLEEYGTSAWEQKKLANLKEQKAFFLEKFGASLAAEQEARLRKAREAKQRRKEVVERRRIETNPVELRRSGRKRKAMWSDEDHNDDPGEFDEEQKSEGDENQNVSMDEGTEVLVQRQEREVDQDITPESVDAGARNNQCLNGGDGKNLLVREEVELEELAVSGAGDGSSTEPPLAKKRFCCDLCDHSTDRLPNLKNHFEDMHSARNVECTRCTEMNYFGQPSKKLGE